MGEKKITEETARRFLSAPPRELIEKFITAIIEKTRSRAWKQSKPEWENIEIKILYKMILRDLRSAILLKLAPTMKNRSKISYGEKILNF